MGRDVMRILRSMSQLRRNIIRSWKALFHYGYSGIDAHTKVCYLMDGIKTSVLDVPTGQILGNPVLHSDFDGSVMLYKDFITQSKSSSSSAPMCNISTAGYERHH
jgi:hypothetical protein